MPDMTQLPKPSVLLVEDDILVRMFCADVLADLDYPVLEAGDAKEALALVDSEPGIGLVITDMSLPGTNGRDFAVEARRRRDGLKFIFASGHGREHVVGSRELAADEVFLAKPFNVADLRSTVQSMLA